MTVTRQIAWRDLCLQADPDFARNSRIVVEYEFTMSRFGGDDRIHRNGRRIFEGDYKNRGAYVPVTVPADAITEDGIPITVDGQFITDTDNG